MVAGSSDFVDHSGGVKSGSSIVNLVVNGSVDTNIAVGIGTELAVNSSSGFWRSGSSLSAKDSVGSATDMKEVSCDFLSEFVKVTIDVLHSGQYSSAIMWLSVFAAVSSVMVVVGLCRIRCDEHAYNDEGKYKKMDHTLQVVGNRLIL